MFSVVKMMKEQGNQFDWSQIAIDIPSLPCFKPEAEWPNFAVSGPAPLQDLLVDGYIVLENRYVVKVTGDEPSLDTTEDTKFIDCEPVLIDVDPLLLQTSDIIPVRGLIGPQTQGVVIILGLKDLFFGTEDGYWGPAFVQRETDYVFALGYVGAGGLPGGGGIG